MTLVGQKVSDGRVLTLIEMFLKQGVLDDLREWTPETGSPQGAVISPLLSNIYLNPLDHQMAQAGFEMVRYADDFVILCRSPEEASQALAVLLQSKWDKPLARISYNFERRSPMPKRIRKRFTAQEKVAILRLHLLERTPISDLCDQHGIHPTMFYRWQKEFFENAAAAFEPRARRAADANERRIALLEQKLQRKHEVLSELMEEHIKLKKELGEL